MTMDTLEKLARKNAEHDAEVKKEKTGHILLMPILIPFVFGYIADFFYPETSGITFFFALSMFAYSFFIAAIGSLLLMPTWLKFVSFCICQIWFTYFWFFNDLYMLSFVPLPFVYLIAWFQRHKIKSANAHK